MLEIIEEEVTMGEKGFVQPSGAAQVKTGNLY